MTVLDFPCPGHFLASRASNGENSRGKVPNVVAVSRAPNSSSLPRQHGLLDERGSHLLTEAVRRLRNQPGEPVDRLLPPILDDLWAAGLRECMEQVLESAAAIPPPPLSFEEFARQRLEQVDDMKRVLRNLDLPPEEFQRQLKELEELELSLKQIKSPPSEK